MSHPISIQGHFDGKVIVPDEPLELPVNQPLIIDIQQQLDINAVPHKNPADFTEEEQEEALRKLVHTMANNPIIPLEALRRVNLYDDGRY